MILQEPVAITYASISNYNVVQDVPLWVSGTIYNEGDKVIIEACGCKVYESLIKNNLSTPSDTSAEWVMIGISNWAAMFDDMSSTQTINNDLIELTLSADRVVTGLSFINIEAASLQVIVTDDAFGEIYNKTFNLIEHKAYDYRDWFLKKPTLIKRFDVADLEPTINGTCTIRLANTGGVVKVGQISRGYRHVIGTCTWGGIQPRIFTYSEINEDAFGTISITQRLKKRDVTYRVQVPTPYLDDVIDLVEIYQDKPALFIGTGDYQGSFVYGLVQDFSPVYENLIDSPYSLTIRGYA